MGKTDMDAEAWLQAGQEHAKNKEWDAALQAYQEALALAPGDARAHYGLGEAYQLLVKQDQAETHYGRALELDPGMALACYNLGELYKAQGRSEEARDVLTRFVELSDDPQKIAKARASLAGLDGQPYRLCAQCGRFATLGDYYREARGQGILCPGCYATSQIKASTTWLWFVPLLAIVSAYGLFNMRGLYPLANFLILALMAYLMIVPHELAHAGMAWLLKGRVFEIRLGLGPVVWQRHFNNVLVSVRRYPVAGLCVPGFPNRRAIQARTFMTTAAGISFSLLMVLLFAPGYNGSNVVSSLAFRETFVIVNGIHVLFNLIPRRVNQGQLQIFTDGGQLLRIATGKWPAESLHVNYFLIASVYAWRRKALAQALAVCQAGLALYPSSSLLKNIQSVLYLEQGEYAAARALFKELLGPFQSGDVVGDPGVTAENRQMMKAMLLNNVAFAAILDNSDRETLQEAYTCAQQAYLMLPWYSAIEGTWGSVLVEVGRVQLGLKYLAACYESRYGDATASDKASTLAYMALGRHRLGEKGKAAALLKQALELDETHHTVRKIQAVLKE